MTIMKKYILFSCYSFITLIVLVEICSYPTRLYAAEIPAEYRGRWSSPADCKASNPARVDWEYGEEERVVIKRRRIDKIEYHCTLLRSLSVKKGYYKAIYKCWDETEEPPTDVVHTMRLKNAKLSGISNSDKPVVRCK